VSEPTAATGPAFVDPQTADVCKGPAEAGTTNAAGPSNSASLRSNTHLEGPCIARAEDIPSLVTLANQVFRLAPRPGDMGKEFPVLLGSDNADNLLIYRDAGRVVSLVGILRQTVHTSGVDIPVACIGAVCTDPSYRKAGLAGRLVDLAIQRSIEAGDLLMPISGKRTLYTSRGATSLGPQIRFHVPLDADPFAAPQAANVCSKGPAKAGTTNAAGPANSASLRSNSRPACGPRSPTPADFTICPCEPADWPRLAALQAQEPVRYHWTDREPRVFDSLCSLGCVCLLACHKDGQPAAALLFAVDHPMYGGKDGVSRVIQFLGDVQAIPALLSHVATGCSRTAMDWPVLTTAEPAVAQTLLAMGATGKPEITRWTVAVLNLPGLVAKIAPAAARAGLELSAQADKLTIAAAGQSITLAQPDLQVELLFRSAATWSEPLARMPLDLRIACSGVLPVPLPDYGLNYV
jgi:predicted N-acetyltransferase YhbS